MGTNYYLFTGSKQLARKYFAEVTDYGYVDAEYEIVDEPRLGYEIHLNKCSCGWRPLFQCHKAFKSFAELETFFRKHEKSLTIYDEYGKEFEWSDYKQMIIDHGDAKPDPRKWVYEKDKIFDDGRKHLMTVSCEPDEAEIWTPFDHLKYARTELEAAKRLNCYDRYYRDPDDFYSHNDEDYPIDWAIGDFS